MIHQVINAVMRARGFSSYAEIGVAYGETFSQVEAQRKVGVDLSDRYTHPAVRQASSDQFFAGNTERFDLVFVDAYHTLRQGLKDAINASRIARCVLVHDVMPDRTRPELCTASVCYGESGWFGDIWKLPLYLEALQWPYSIYEPDWGFLQTCGVIPWNDDVLETVDQMRLEDYRPLHTTDLKTFAELA